MSAYPERPVTVDSAQLAPGTPRARWSHVLQISLLLVILLTAGAVRFALLTHQSLFFDELWNVELATGRGSMHFALKPGHLYSAAEAPRVTSLTDAPPIWALWSGMNGVTHPPL